jgi:hypothetical protein
MFACVRVCGRERERWGRGAILHTCERHASHSLFSLSSYSLYSLFIQDLN